MALLEAPPAPAVVSPQAGSGSRRWWGLFAILSADLLNLLDGTVGNIAGPAIRAELGGSLATLQWIVAGYTLAMAVGLLTGGRLGDMFGRKRMMMVGVGGFLAASLACALAFSPETLIIARVLQGGFGALMVPQSFGLLRDLFGAQVGKAFAALGPVIGLATILGPVVAGLLVEADLFGTGWRAIFLINLPLGAFAMYVGWKVLPDTPPAARGSRLDVGGAVIAAIAMAMLVIPLVQGHELGWPAWTLGLLAASVPVFALFVAHQLRRTRAGRVPLVELSVFAKRSYAAGVAFVVAFFGAITGFSVAVGFFLQLGLGYTPLAASLAMVSWAVGAFLGSGFGGAMMNRLGRHILHIGLALMAAGLIGLYAVFSIAGRGVDGWDMAAPMLVFGLGMGMIFVPLFDIIVGGLADREVGSASGMLSSFQQLGASLGVAVLGTVFFSVRDFVAAAALVTLITIALTAVTFALGFLLPRRARQSH
ncbi:MFS transporter [Bailinhaonella thermotolerans]|uniref:MFS transporter n=1 Tax=Bailinhaonella thermotolerans TaxID=1070861 RepID=A0A3A4A201_9ACTN|nr:MFS transporter [Bailinhaonella thermotolerans]RJL22601.1 MFS transporter [Bailinhaonella thermotolerans]